MCEDLKMPDTQLIVALNILVSSEEAGIFSSIAKMSPMLFPSVLELTLQLSCSPDIFLSSNQKRKSEAKEA